MKKKLSVLLAACSIFALAGCTVVPAESPDPTVPASVSEKTPTPPKYSENTPVPTAHEDISLQAQEVQEVSSGTYYDLVSSIYSDVSLIESGNDIIICIFIEHINELKDSILFFEIISNIIQDSKLEDYYSSATFMMYVDKSFTALFTLLDFTSPVSFVSSEPIVIKSDYEEHIKALYVNIFSSSDIMNNFDKALEDLRKKYNLSN